MVGNRCVILGDVVDSRKIDERSEFKRELEETFKTVNEQYAAEIHAPFKTLKGIDEFGGVLQSISAIADIQKTISRGIHPESARIVAVVGEIDVNRNSDDVAQMDGTAFSRADMLLSELERDGFTFKLSGTESGKDDLVSDLINLLDIVRSGWSERRMEVLIEYERRDSQKAAADALGISVQAVSQHVTESNVDKVRRIEQRLSSTVRQYTSFESA